MKTRKHFLKISAIALSLTLLFSSVGITALAAEKTPQGMIEENRDFEQAHSDMLYAMFEAMLRHDDDFDISGYGLEYSQENLQATFDAIRGVFPEIFYLDTMQCSGYYDYNSDKWYMKDITFVYSMNANEAAEKLTAFYAKADEYLALVDDTMDDFTKALILHDALALNSHYKAPNSNTYTLMVEGWGRCECYAEAYAYLLAQVGIKSEIVSSDNMNHEWMKIRLGGDDYYYNIDLTWDDPNFSNGEHQDFASHQFFLLSDAEIQDAKYGNDRHYGYTTNYPSTDATFDNHTNLHSQTNPFFAVNGTLYTLIEKNEKGYIATYDYQTDSYTEMLEINDVWYDGSQYSWWPGNYSSIAAYDGLLYFNTPDAVYTYNPVTREKTLFSRYTGSDLLYGMYIRDGKVYGLAAANPNVARTSVELGEPVMNYVLGDTDGDGIVNIVDATIIQYHLAEYSLLTGKRLKAADFDKNGTVDINDVTAIQIYINL
ncbi:MAG: hypothetical protein IJ598_10380 [Ruminococcus sp.]|nr:hypothetical protein [Ruminococcus sp.]